MKGKIRSWKERMGALLLAVFMIVTWILPDMASTVQAAPGDKVDVVFSVKDIENNSAILNEGVTITIYDAAGQTVMQTVTEAEQDGTYKVPLTEGEKYVYAVNKTGYEYNNASLTREFIPQNPDQGPDVNKIDVGMKMSEIIVSENSLDLNVGESKYVYIKNAVIEAGYTWSVISGDAYVSVFEGTITANAAGAAGDDSDKTATVQVSIGRKSRDILVKVSKNSFEMSLSLKEPEGIDQSRVVLTAEGIPEDAAGTLTFKEDQNTIDEVDVRSGKETVYTDPGLIARKNFSVQYSGDIKYTEQRAEAAGKYTRTEKLVIDGETSKTVTYGENGWDNIYTIPLKADTIKGRKINAKAELDKNDFNSAADAKDVADITVEDNTVKVTPLNTGKIKITITAEQGNTDYETSEAEVVFTVNRKTIDITDIDWEKEQSKVYDGETGFELTGIVKGTNEKITIPAQKANVKNKDVAADENNNPTAQDVTIEAGTYYTTVESGAANCQLVVGDTDNIVQNVGTITRRPLYLTASGEIFEVPYGQNIKDAVEGSDTALVKLIGGTGAVPEGPESDGSGLVGSDSVADIPGATIEGGDTRLEVRNELFKIIIPNITDENRISGNYEFKFENNDDNKGSLKVIPQTMNKQDLLGNIALADTAGTYGITEGAGNAAELVKIYAAVGGKDETGGSKEAPVLKLQVKSSDTFDASEYYDQVLISLNGGEPVNASEDGVSLEVLESVLASVDEDTDGKAVDDKVKIKIYLGRSDSEATRTTGTEMADWLHIDNKAPTADIKDYTPTVFSKMLDAVTFGLFSRTSYNATVTVNDKGSGLSGTVTQKYYVYEMGRENADLTAPGDVKTIIEEIDKNRWWKELDLSSGRDNISVGEGESEEVIKNNYLIFIRTQDNAGNCAVYVSNGIVIETTAPTLECEFEAPVSQGMQDGVMTYEFQSDAEYTLTIKDPGDYFSGIGEVDVEVTAGGSVIGGNNSEDEPEMDAEGRYVNSYSYKNSREKSTYSQLKEDSDITIRGIVQDELIETNDVMIQITAYDRAGNKSQVYKSRLIIDNTDPGVTVSYNNAENPANNDIYFNNKDADRIMTIEYQERNMTVDAAGNYTGITFDLIVDGQKYEDVSLDELGDYNITCKSVEDNQSRYESNQHTEERVTTVELHFAADGEYTIIPKCEDRLGNTNVKREGGKETAVVNYTDKDSKANETFVIDTTPPEIEVIYQSEGKTFHPKTELLSYGERAYSQKEVQAAVTITEKNFWKTDEKKHTFADGQMNFKGTQGTDYEGNKVDGTDQDNYQKIAEATGDHDWSSKDSERTNSNFKFAEDANYVFAFTYTDLAGNTAVYDPRYFTVDNTNPEGSIAVTTNDGRNVWDTVLSTLTFGLFDKFSNADSVLVELKGEDVTSGVCRVEYYNLYDSDTPKSYEEITALSDDHWTKADEAGSCEVQPDRQFIPYMRVTDWAGNMEYFSTESGFIADQTKPEITITELNKNQSRNGIYSENVELGIRVKDPANGNTYSGIEEIWYEVTASGNVNVHNDENTDKDMVLVDHSANRVKGNQEWYGTITIPADTYNSNDVEVTVYARDFSDNVFKKTIELMIDVTDPEINVTYDLNNPQNGRYYNAVRTATVTVTERNFDPSAVRFSITNTDGTQPSISGWSHSADSGVSDSATHTCTVTFAADGDYTFTLNTTDLAGNDSHYTRVDDFTIDQTDPTIQVSYDNNRDAEPGYFNADRTATITITEHNFRASDVNAVIAAALEGRGVSTPSLSGWTTRGDVHTASVTFSADADYTFDVDYTDLAGNTAADYTQDSFTIDQTAPEVEFFDIVDKSANNDVAAPGVNYSDVNYTPNGVEITLKGAKHAETAMSGARSAIPNGESIKMDDFERTREADDLYTLKAVIKDRAGNATEKSVIFSVNRFGSVYILSDDTQELVDDYYTNEEQDLVVTEINVDSLVFNGISYGRDGELKTLEAGTDYTVKESGSEVSWKQYQYTVNKENFTKEGNYIITIDSEDKATNVANNQVKGCDIEFAVDKTAPTVVVSGIGDNEQYRADTRDMEIDVSDNIAMGDVEIYVDDSAKPVKTYRTKEIEKNNGAVVYTIENSNAFQNITAVAKDAAGNETETSSYRVLVTSNLFVQYYSNKPLLIGSIIAVVLIAGGICWFIIAKRKKQEEK